MKLRSGLQRRVNVNEARWLLAKGRWNSGLRTAISGFQTGNQIHTA